MLSQLNSKFDKSVGSWAYDILFPPSKQVVDLEKQLEHVDSKRSIFNLKGDELDRFINQFSSVTRNRATQASGEVFITGKPEAVIQEGTMVASAAHTYETTERKVLGSNGKATVKIQAQQRGATANTSENTIVQFPITIKGLETVSNPKPITGGFEEESDDDLRSRFFEYINLPVTSGNIYHYKTWAMDIEGVGAVRVNPLWDGDNTIRLVLIDSNGQSASEDLVNEVQEYVDPKGEQRDDGTWTKWGCGYGEAPVGAFCTVIPANKVSIKITVDIVLEYGEDIEKVKEDFTNKMIKRFSTIALEEENRIISVAQTGATLLSTDGVKDYDSRTLMINGSQENIILGDEDVAYFEEVILNEQ